MNIGQIVAGGDPYMHVPEGSDAKADTVQPQQNTEVMDIFAIDAG